jgi:hypothetical protein
MIMLDRNQYIHILYAIIMSYIIIVENYAMCNAVDLLF